MPLDLFWHRHFTHPGVILVQAVMSHTFQVLKIGSHIKKQTNKQKKPTHFLLSKGQKKEEQKVKNKKS